MNGTFLRMGPLLPPPVAPHTCILPYDIESSKYAKNDVTRLPPGSVWRCDECGQHWKAWPKSDSVFHSVWGKYNPGLFARRALRKRAAR